MQMNWKFPTCKIIKLNFTCADSHRSDTFQNLKQREKLNKETILFEREFHQTNVLLKGDFTEQMNFHIFTKHVFAPY
jgi:hypothetical protein